MAMETPARTSLGDEREQLTKFLHTSDWHLGMRAGFLLPEARSRFTFDRYQAVKEIAKLAADESCEFVVVAGDAFDSNHVSEEVVDNAVDALRQFTVPVYILPGNHDYYDPGSVYLSRRWLEHRPPLVHVVTDSDPISVSPGVELVGAPIFGKNLSSDPLTGLLETSPESDAPTRIVIGHGVVTGLTGATEEPDLISAEAILTALRDRTIAYVALGDRHGLLEIPGSDGRAYYSGTPVSTGHGYIQANQILTVELNGEFTSVQPRAVGHWRFEDLERDLNTGEDVSALERTLDAYPDKPHTVVRLNLRGTLSLTDSAELDRIQANTVFAQINRWERHTDLVIAPTDRDLEALDVSGYERKTLEDLHALAVGDGDQAQTARDALNLFYRLTR